MKMLRAGDLRHQCDIYAPGTSSDNRGQHHGKTLIRKGVPCSVETLSGRELEQARATWTEATYKVEMYGDPRRPIDETCWLEMNGRRMNIAHKSDPDFNEIKLTLLCGELKPLEAA